MNNHTFFENTDCEFYPCHRLSSINCLFCFCPLYSLPCGGNFVLTEGKKDCSACTLVHDAHGYEFVLESLVSKNPPVKSK